MIWRLIRKNISAVQTVGYAIAAVAGLSIVLCAIKFAFDSGAFLSSSTSGNSDYIVISKPASMLGSFIPGSSSSRTISEREIADIEQQPWAKHAGAFSAASFAVTASIELQNRGLSTQLFLESVPDEFLDTIPTGWHFDPTNANATVPVILPREYLSLYNYGYAASQGLSQLSEGVVSDIYFNLYLNGRGRTQRRAAHIAAFSDRINTIAVPDTFMRWANANFGNGSDSQPSRLIVKVDPSRSTEMEQYLKSHGLETSAGALDRTHARELVDLATGVVSGIGIAICLLALFILVLSTSLLMQKNKEKNRQLLLLGFSHGQVAAPYIRLTLATNVVVYAVSATIMLIVSSFWQAPLRSLGITPASGTLAALGIGAVITAVISLAAIQRIRKSITTRQNSQ